MTRCMTSMGLSFSPRSFQHRPWYTAGEPNRENACIPSCQHLDQAPVLGVPFLAGKKPGQMFVKSWNSFTLLSPQLPREALNASKAGPIPYTE